MLPAPFSLGGLGLVETEIESGMVPFVCDDRRNIGLALG